MNFFSPLVLAVVLICIHFLDKRRRGRVAPREPFPQDSKPSAAVPLPSGAGRCTRPVYADSDLEALAIFIGQTYVDYWKTLTPRER